MGKHLANIVVLSFILIPLDIALAKDVPAQGRIFAGATKVKPDDLNTELAAQSLKEIDNLPSYGVEITYPVASFIDVGLRYTKRYILVDESNSSPSTFYQADLNQDSFMAILRIPFIKTNFLRLDAFAGFGGTNTSVKIKSATPQDGELSRKDAGGWVAQATSSFGGSVAIGYKMIYFVIEGGVETNKVDSLKRFGTINSNVDTIDLSGSYFTVGLLFDGVGVSRK